MLGANDTMCPTNLMPAPLPPLGFLDRLAFHKAMDLISIAQQGQEITRYAALTN